MARLLAAAVAVAAFLLVGAFYWDKPQTDLRHYTVGLSSSKSHDDIYCSGTIIDRTGGILTAAHCVLGIANSNAPVYIIRYAPDGKGKVYRAHFAWIGKTADISLIRIDGKIDLGVEAPIAEPGALRIGESVRTVGMPLGFHWVYTYGKVGSDQIEDLGRPEFYGWLVLDITAGPGSSGGGIFNDDGELIGVLVAMISQRLPMPIPIIGTGDIMFGVPLDVIHRYLP